MGGRGIKAKANNAQVKMDDYIRHLEVENIRKTWEMHRAELRNGIGGATGNQMMRKKCACCLQYTLPAFTEYEQCPLCGWIDDPEQNLNPTSNLGHNSISLLEARQKWTEKKADG